MTNAYDLLLAELANGELGEVEQKVYEALKRNPGGLLRAQLVAIVFGESVRAGSLTNNNTKDRKVRKAIEGLRARLIPIVSSSGKAGYKLDTSKEARDRMLADLRSRRAHLDDLIERATKFYSMPGKYYPAEKATQERLV